MNELPAPKPNGSRLTFHVDQVFLFDEVVITDPTELAALYLPTPKNLVVHVNTLQEFVDQAIPAPIDGLDGPANS